MLENTDVTVATEFCHIQDLAKDNSMIIHLVKSKEIVFIISEPYRSSFLLLYSALNEYH